MSRGIAPVHGTSMFHIASQSYMHRVHPLTYTFPDDTSCRCQHQDVSARHSFLSTGLRQEGFRHFLSTKRSQIDVQEASARTNHPRNGKINMMDGAFDSTDEGSSSILRRSSSFVAPNTQPARLSRVRFLSDEDLRSKQNSTSYRGGNPFSNPFTDEMTSVSRRTSSSSDTTTYLRPNAFAGHRDTLARLPRYAFIHDHDDNELASRVLSLSTDRALFPVSRVKVPLAHSDTFLPEPIVNAVLELLSFEDYKALRLVCRQWNVSIPLPCFPAVFRLPREILQQVYSYLSLCDFDAARHTSRAWYLASLDWKVQEPIARSSGIRSAVDADIQRQKDSLADRRSIGSVSGPFDDDYDINKEWICSKRLATESRLSPDWAGLSLSGGYGSFTRLSIVEEVDFSKITAQDAPSRSSRSMVSACGRFVLVVCGGDITLYSLSNPENSIVPVVRLSAGIEVLKVSMDTSSERYSVAALLSGRLGMLWDLQGTPLQTRYRTNSGEPMNLGMQTTIQDSAIHSYARPLVANLPISSQELLAAEANHDDSSPPSMLGGTSSPGFVPSPPSL